MPHLELPVLEQRHWDLIGLGLVGFAAFFACVFYLGWAGGEVGEALANAILFMFGGVGYGAPVVLFAAGALIVIRPMIPAVHPFRTGTLCFAAALMLGLAAGSLGLGPGDTPRDGFLDASYLEHHGGLVGESLFWASAKLFSTAGSHILFTFLLLAGVLLLTGASIAGIVTATREAAVTTTERVRRTTGTVRVPYEPLPPIAPPEPDDREPVVRATHVEMPVTDEFDEYEPEPEPEYEDDEGSDPMSAPDSGGQTPSVEETEIEEPELTPMGNRRSAVTESDDIEYRMPKLSFLKRAERRPEARHEGNRADGGAARGGAQPLQRGGAPDRDRERSARDPLRAAPRARHQDVEGRHAEGRPRLRARRRAGAHPRARSPASRPWEWRCPTACARWCTSATSSRTRRRAGRRCRSGSARTSPARRSAPTSPSSRTS